MLTTVDGTWTQGEYLNFRDQGPVSRGSITHKFSVTSRLNGSVLGYVKWWAQWRQYTYWPTNCLLDKKCLREIADFCEQKTAEQKANR